MSIRGRLLALAIGGVLPLLIVGLTVLGIVWSEKQNQLNEGLEQQAELAAVVFDRWLDAQFQPLRTIASYPPNHLKDPSALEGNLKAVLIHRLHWIDLRVLDASGKVLAIQPAGASNLPSGVAEKLVGEVRRGDPDVETDWTRGEGRYLLAVAVPLEGGGAVVARIDGAALTEPLQGITLPERALVTLLDQRRRIIYRSQTAESALGLDLSGIDQLSALNDRNTAVIVKRSSLDGVERAYGLGRVGKTGYVVMVGVPSAILYASAWRQLMGYAVVGLIVVFGTMTGALLIARSIARPVRLLNFAAEEFGGGNFAARAPTEGQDEVSRLGMNFNAMAERLQKREARLAELDRLKSEFVSTVSHELRTPLTTIKALTRLLMRDGLDEKKRREYIETISVECDRQIDLDCDHVVAVALKDRDYVLPARSIGEGAMNEHNRRLRSIPRVTAFSFLPRDRSPARRERGLAMKGANDEAGEYHADEQESDDAATSRGLSNERAPVYFFEHFVFLHFDVSHDHSRGAVPNKVMAFLRLDEQFFALDLHESRTHRSLPWTTKDRARGQNFGF